MPAGPFKNKIRGFVLDGSILLVEKFDNERFVFFNWNLIKGNEGGAGVKRFACVGKNVSHYMLFATAKDKRDILCLLYVGAQQCLHVLFWIVAYLLELINSNHYLFTLQTDFPYLHSHYCLYSGANIQTFFDFTKCVTQNV